MNAGFSSDKKALEKAFPLEPSQRPADGPERALLDEDRDEPIPGAHGAPMASEGMEDLGPAVFEAGEDEEWGAEVSAAIEQQAARLEPSAE